MPGATLLILTSSSTLDRSRYLRSQISSGYIAILLERHQGHSARSHAAHLDEVHLLRTQLFTLTSSSQQSTWTSSCQQFTSTSSSHRSAWTSSPQLFTSASSSHQSIWTSSTKLFTLTSSSQQLTWTSSSQQFTLTSSSISQYGRALLNYSL